MTPAGRKVGVALGGGGVRGLGHIPALEAIDRHGIRPDVLSGTSMGAIIAALYASGKSGRDIRNLVARHSVTRDDGILDLYAKKDSLMKWLDAVRIAWTGSGLLRADGFLRHLTDQMEVRRFEQLKIPLKVVATDFYTGEAVIFESGPILPALEASMSIPGIFVPVEYRGRLLVDGGVSNNLPYDILQDDCDLTIAVDVAPTRVRNEAAPPSLIDASLGMFDLLVDKVTRAMIEAKAPDIYFHPRLVGIRVLEFDKAEEVFSQVDQCMGDFNRLLSGVVDTDRESTD